MSESDGKLSVKTYGKQAKGHGDKIGGELLKAKVDLGCREKSFRWVLL